MDDISKKITLLVPVFNLSGDRLNNFEFVLRKICEVSNNVLVVEQVQKGAACKDSSGCVKDITDSFGAQYLSIVIDDNKIHKSRIINEGTKICNTPFVWVNDADCYMNFDKVLGAIDLNYDFIQPYKLAKRCSKAVSTRILSGEKVRICYRKITTPAHCASNKGQGYISLYGALSFIYRVDSFLAIGGMNEEFTGWGGEDTDLCYRVVGCYSNVVVINSMAIHLYHDLPEKNQAMDFDSDKVLVNIHKRQKSVIIREIKEAYNVLAMHNPINNVGIIAFPRTGSSCLKKILTDNLGLTFINEPFGTSGIIRAAHKNPFQGLINDEKYEDYVREVINSGLSIKHVYDELVPLPDDILNKLSDVTRRIIQSRDVIIIMTRRSFLDSLVSSVVSTRENNFFGKKYSLVKEPITKSTFNNWLQRWTHFHKVELGKIMRECTKNKKPYLLVDFEDIFDIDRLVDRRLKRIFPFGVPRDLIVSTNRQRTGECDQYISNYEEVLSWCAEAGVLPKSKREILEESITTLEEEAKFCNVDTPSNFSRFKDVIVNSSTLPYRIGDVFFGFGNADDVLLERIDNGFSVGSIGESFLKNLPRYGNDNFNLAMKDAINQSVFVNNRPPEPTEMCISLRLSDKRTGAKHDRNKCLDEILTILSSTPCNKVTLVLGLHYPLQGYPAALVPEKIKEKRLKRKASITGDVNILSNYVSTIEAAGYQVEVKSSEDPDEDLVYLAKAKYLIITRSSFGAIAYRLGDATNKWVIDTTDELWFRNICNCKYPKRKKGCRAPDFSKTHQRPFPQLTQLKE